MKNRYSIPAALLLLLLPGCENKSSETAKQLEELERKANEAVERQRELEQQLEDQKIAAERDAIERERLLIEEDRLELERKQGEAAAAEAEVLRRREEALANREGQLQQVRSDLEEKETLLAERGVEPNARDRELAGREAIPFEVVESTEPVADYDMFYDSLAAYGSWFETPDYGYVWQPAVISDSNWRPYSRGRWVCSDRGWTWVSEEPFGWATYHYGRWALIRGRGWVWVPGTEWAPCWVSWRESGSHIGWAPLPPETMAYRNHRWDSNVDDQFGIGFAWFNFVEIRHFGSPLYQYCLPVSRNSIFIQGTVNITYIHLVNRQVICGGPQYEKINRRLGRPIPFYRLELEGRSRQSREALGMRPRIKGDRLMVSAPNMDASWNDGLRPARVKGRIDTQAVERKEPLRPEITDRFKKSREEGQRIARRSVDELGGPENFIQKRVERLEENRKQVEEKAGKPVKEHEAVKAPDRKPREETKRPPENRVDEGTAVAKNPDPVREARPRQPVAIVPKAQATDVPAVTPPADVRPPEQETQDAAPKVGKPRDPNPTRPQELNETSRELDRDPRVQPQDALKRQQALRPEENHKKAAEPKNQDAVPQLRKAEGTSRGLQMDDLIKHREQQEKLRQQKETQSQAQQVADAREAARQKQEEQERQMQRQAQQAREAREQALQKQRQRDEAIESARQKQLEQRQEMERQQERARQKQEQQRQEDAERQQQRDRQRQQEESQRQQQQERGRQQEQSRQREQEQNQRQQEKAREAETEKSRVRDSERSRNR